MVWSLRYDPTQHRFDFLELDRARTYWPYPDRIIRFPDTRCDFLLSAIGTGLSSSYRISGCPNYLYQSELAKILEIFVPSSFKLNFKIR